MSDRENTIAKVRGSLELAANAAAPDPEARAALAAAFARIRRDKITIAEIFPPTSTGPSRKDVEELAREAYQKGAREAYAKGYQQGLDDGRQDRTASTRSLDADIEAALGAAPARWGIGSFDDDGHGGGYGNDGTG